MINWVDWGLEQLSSNWEKVFFKKLLQIQILKIDKNFLFSKLQQLRETQDRDLSTLCQQLLLVRGCLIRERERIVSIVAEKDRIIQQQRIEIERLRNSGSTVSGPISAGLDRVRPGSIRQHGSFRQYKKEKIRQRNYGSSSESNLSSSTG